MELLRRRLLFLIILIGSLSALALPVRVASADEGSAEVTLTLTITALTISDVSVSDLNSYSAAIRWKTNGDATSQAFYDILSHDNVISYAYHTSEGLGLVSEHSLTLTGLASSTTYHFRVKSRIPETDFVATSDDYTFRTLTLPVAPGPPTYYIKTNLFGVVKNYRISYEGKILETIEATTEDNMLTITIPKGTIALDKDGRRLKSLAAAVDESPPDPSKDGHIIGLVYDLGPDRATFDPPITLTWSYNPDALPEGVAEEDLVITYYDEDTGKWIELDSVVDTQPKTISAKVSHFTPFAVLGYKAVVPPVLPAAFTVSHLSVLPSEVYIGARVTISVIATNIGGQSGIYEVALKINGVVEATKEVTVNTGLSKEITFTTTRDIAGTYLVDVDGLTDSFTVKEKPAPAAFSVTNLSIQPTQVQPKEVVTITVLVSNIGGVGGSYTVVLKINGVKEAEESVILEAGKSQDVSFSVTREEPGVYTVTVDDLSGSFTVAEVPPVKPPVNWPLIGGIIAAVVVVGLVVFFLLRRMTRGK